MTTKTRFDGARCECCRALLKFQEPSGLTVSSGEQVDVFHEPPWCSRWLNPVTRELCIPKAILEECMKEKAS